MNKKFGAQSALDEVLSDIDLRGKRVLIIGISSNVGFETGRALAARGASVIGIDLVLTRAESIRRVALQGGGNLELLELNLGSLQSVHACADRLLIDGRPFNAIIGDVAVMATPPRRTVDGFETQFWINYLSHFVLFNRIARLLVQGGRLVMVSSPAHRFADIDLDDLNLERQNYDSLVAYGRSKTATSLFAVAFDRRYRHRGIRAVSVMCEKRDGISPANGDRRHADVGLLPSEFKDITQAAATSVWAAILANKDDIGGHCLENGAVALIDDSPNPFADGVRSYALDADKANQLWRKSEALIFAAPLSICTQALQPSCSSSQ